MVPLSVGAVLGTFLIGAPLSEMISGDLLKRIFGVVMVLFGLRMLGGWEWITALVR
jgi:uncharacterized membrane protein YfcA